MPRLGIPALLALGVCALVVSASRASLAAPALLHEGRRPPAFTLPDTAGNLVRLGTLLGSKRILLVFLPGSRDSAAQKYLQMLVRERARLEARDLVVLAVAPPKSAFSPLPVSPPVTLLHDNAGKVACIYGTGGRAPVSYLIGKDGGVKIARSQFLSLRELYGVIDAMPMRREEMRRRGR